MSNQVIFLTRHATPEPTAEGMRYDIPPGPRLSVQGEGEAARLGHFLVQVGVNRLYASPLERAQRTAAVVGQTLGVAVHTQNAIAEWRREESRQDVVERMTSFWESMAASPASEESAGPIAFVSHGGPIRCLLEVLTGDVARIDDYCRRYPYSNPLPPAGAWRAERQTNGAWVLDLVFVPGE